MRDFDFNFLHFNFFDFNFFDFENDENDWGGLYGGRGTATSLLNITKKPIPGWKVRLPKGGEAMAKFSRKLLFLDCESNGGTPESWKWLVFLKKRF